MRTVHQWFNRVGTTLRSVANKANEGFNVVKGRLRSILPDVKYVAGLVRATAKNYSDLPGVGQVASTIGSIAHSVERGSDLLRQGLNVAERGQNFFNLPTG